MLKRALTNFSHQLNGNLDRNTKILVNSLNRSLSTLRLDGNILTPSETKKQNLYTGIPTLLKVTTVNFEDKSHLADREEVKVLLRLGELENGENDIELEKFTIRSIMDTISYLAAKKSSIVDTKEVSKLLLEHILTSTKRQKEMNPDQYANLLDYLVGLQLKMDGLKDAINIEKVFDLYFNHKYNLIAKHLKSQTLLIKLSTHREYHQSLPSLIDIITEKKIDLHTSNSVYLIRHLLNHSKIRSVIKYQNFLKDRITGQALYRANYEFVRGYCQLGKMNLVEEIIKSMQVKGVPIPFFFHLNLIHGYGSQGDIDKLSNHYIYLLNQNILKVPEKLTNTVSIYCKTSDQIQKVLNAFTDLNVELVDELYIMNSKIKLSLINKDIISANYILEEMKEKGIEPNHLTFIPLLDYYIQINDFEKAWKVFTTSKQHILNSDHAKPIYDRIVNLCCIHKKPDLAYTLVNDILNNSKTLDCSTFSPLLEYYFKNHKLSRVIEIYDELFEKNSLPFDGYLFNIYLKSLCKLGDMNLVLNKFFKVLEEEKIFLQVEFIRLIAQGLGMNSNVYRILEFFNNPIILSKHPIDSECYNSALFGLLLGRHWEEVFKLLELKEFSHNSKTLELVCGFGTRHERFSDVIYWYDKLLADNSKKIKPSPKTLEGVIISQFNLGNFSEVEKLFDLYSSNYNQKLSFKVLGFYLKSIIHLNNETVAVKKFEKLKEKFKGLDTFELSQI
jgi:hypothetical protein